MRGGIAELAILQVTSVLLSRLLLGPLQSVYELL